MMNRLKIYLIAFVVFTIVSCAQPGGDNPGSEYVPDMGHSIGYEANYYDYYGLNRWGTKDEYHELVQPRDPVAGTIPRGYAGVQKRDAEVFQAQKMNGFVPYYYEDTEEERTRATEEIIDNPYPITAEGLARGKELYDIFCGICHGPKGGGNGWLVADENPNVKYNLQPANMLTDEFVNASNGRYYHAIMYGKNAMGAYKDKINYEERWQVIHYIRSLQAKDRKLAYNSDENTLNDVEVPASQLADATPAPDAASQLSMADEAESENQ